LARRATETPTAQPIPRHTSAKVVDSPLPGWVANALVAVTGFATFALEIAWMRLLAMIIGPSTAAFSATVAVFITAIAAGGLLSETWLHRSRRRRLALAVPLALAS